MSTGHIVSEHVIIIARHGESLKNVQDRHGGPGEPLTAKGKEEVDNLVSSISKISVQPRIIYCSNIPQVLETARILSDSLIAKITFDERIRPLDLGVLSGLSREEALQRYPGPAELMEKWRRGEIEIGQLEIPLAEGLEAFWKRGLSFIDSIKYQKGLDIIVGTRSILTLLISILLKRGIEPGGGYKAIEIPSGGFATFALHNDSHHALQDLSNLKLSIFT